MPCQFCLRPVRHTNLRRICGPCRRTGRIICLTCALPYIRNSGHNCAVNLPRCLHCFEPHTPFRLALPIDAGRNTQRNERRGLCKKCLALGCVPCEKNGCAKIAEKPGKHRFCSEHHPLPPSSLWRKGILPLGGPPFLNTCSWRSFGIEIECFRERGRVVASTWVPPKGWGKGVDGSISPGFSTETAEFRSPPYYGDLGLAQLIKDVLAIQRSGFSGVNKSCGTHVHIDFSATTEDDQRALFKFAKAFESQVFELVAPSRRENSYCKKLPGRMTFRDRYRWLNFAALREFGTVEVRLHQGSTSAIRIAMWVRLMLRLVEAGVRQGRQRIVSSRSLFDVLDLSTRERIYWTARRNRFIRDQQERQHRAQPASQSAPVEA